MTQFKVKRGILLGSILFPLISLTAQNEWDDVRITHVNREEAHTLAIPFDGKKENVSPAIEKSPYYFSLNGKWKFNWVPTPDKKPENFFDPSYDVSQWDDIEVPCPWQIYGVRNQKNWDKPLYVNTRYPFTYTESYSVMADRPADWTYNNAMKNPVGSYRKDFDLPKEWKDRDVFVRFNGAGHGYYVWVNGKQVGYAEDSYLPSEFNITDYLTAGKNTIAVQIYRFTSGSFLECQDYWRFTGITRDVFLWSAPKTQIRDYFFQTDLDEQYRDAEVTLDVKLTGKALKSGKLTAKILDKGNVIAESVIEKPAIGQNSFKFKISNPQKWTAETPYLYDLVISLDNKKTNIDLRGNKVGFREVGIAPNGALTVNGKRVVFHGVNRHDHSEINGRTVSKEEMELDIKNMKRLNINAVRTSHYPNNPYFYDLCDQYGLYVLAEANVECHGNTGLSSVEAFREAMVERSENQVKWLRNHPAICLWSFGNESGNGNNFSYVAKAIKALDKTRLTHYEGNSQWSDVSSTMYANYDHIRNIGMEREREFKEGKQPRPHIQCENSHAMGNAMGNVREMFDLYEHYPALTGEFIWDWKDQSLKMEVPGKAGEYYWAYGGDFGDNPNDGSFCTNGVIFADYSWSAKCYNTKKIYQPVVFKAQEDLTTFTLKDQLTFKSTDDFDFYYSILEDGKILKTEKIEVSLAPGESKNIQINALPATALKEAEYFIRFSVKQKEATWWAEKGYEVASEQIALKGAEKAPYALADGAIEVDENGNLITLSGKNFKATFSKTEGTLVNYTYNGKTLICDPLKLNVFRAGTENDKAQTGDWNKMGLRDLTVEPGEWSIQKGSNSVDLYITNVYKAANPHTFITQLSFKVAADGTIFVNSTIDPTMKNVVLPKIGYILEMPAGFENFTWFGRGPWDSYEDRKEACFEGIYNSTVKEQWTGYVLPQEMGNKEDVRWMTLTNNAGDGLLFIAPDQMDASVAHWRPEDMILDRSGNRIKHPYQMKFRENTVVSLDARNRALGNASCGADVMDKYELKAEYTLFNFMIQPLEKKYTNDELAQKARVKSPICNPVKIDQNEKGEIVLSTTTQPASIYYQVGNGKEQLYQAPFTLPKGGSIKAYCKAEGFYNSMPTQAEIGLFIDKSNWKIVSVSSQDGNEKSSNAIDNKENTIWHSRFGNNEPHYPHEIIVDMAQTYRVSKFIYQARKDGANGRIRAYEVYFSNNPKQWGEPAIRGEFANTSAPQRVNLPIPTDARYFKLIALSSIDRRNWASAAELSIEAINGVKKETKTFKPLLQENAKYRIKHAASGLYLQYLPDQSKKYEGDFCINKNNAQDESFIFTFTPVEGFTSFYTVKVNGKQMIKGEDGWRCSLGEAEGSDGWIQLEQLDDQSMKMKGLWQPTYYINLDAEVENAYIYPNKSEGAIWKLEKVQ